MAITSQFGAIILLLDSGRTADAREKLMELREAVAHLEDERDALRGQLKALGKPQEHKEPEPRFDGSVYWRQRVSATTGLAEDVYPPCCPRCKEKDGELSPLRELDSGRGRICEVCEEPFPIS